MTFTCIIMLHYVNMVAVVSSFDIAYP